jgi:hypothetical protein
MRKPDSDPTWVCAHFSVSNPAGAKQADLPGLLRRTATRIAALGRNVTVLDLTVHDDVTDDGSWFTVTVYYTFERFAV